MRIKCKYAQYKAGKIWCRKSGQLCAHQKFCRMDGVFKHTEQALQCALLNREEVKKYETR